MSDANLRQIRILHVVSSGAVPSGLQQSLFMPLLTRMPKQRVKTQVVSFAPNVVPAAVLRQHGVPVHEVALSRERFSMRGFGDLVRAVKLFRPDVIQAWGHSAQIASIAARKRCDWKPRVVWSVADTAPLARKAGLIDRQKLKFAAKSAPKADRIVYASEAGASQHRRAGFPDGGHLTVPPGVDATRFKPDFAVRRKVREQLQLPSDAFVLGMVAPFQPEYDHATLLKAAGELIKTHPNLCVVLAGHGVQKGNGPLMALVGGSTLGARTQLLGEWSDLASLFNACDIVCSSALNDSSRMLLISAMLCGVPCVATGMGAQGEVIGQFGVAIEPGSPAAFIKGITRVMQLTPEKRASMAHGARKHALQNFVSVRSLQKYLQLYYDLIGRQALVTEEVPTPAIDATVTVPPPLPRGATAPKKGPVTISELADPDSLEEKVTEHSAEQLPKWRLEQEEQRAKRESELSQRVAASQTVGDVLQVFESQIARPAAATSAMAERARGVAEEVEELLSPEMLATPAPAPQRAPASQPKAAKNEPVSAPPRPAQAVKVATIEAAAPVSSMGLSSVPSVAPRIEPVIEPKPRPVTMASVAAASAPANQPEPVGTLSLFQSEPPMPVVTAMTSQSPESALQLELLPEPAAERKRAVGESP